jgi:hypothetical protein
MNNIGQYVRVNNSTNFVKINEYNNTNIKENYNNNENIIEIDNSINNNNVENFEKVSNTNNFTPRDNLYNFYKPFKIFNILFCFIGKNLCFGFNENYEPFFAIGPHWYLFILLSIIIYILCYILLINFIKIYGSYIIFFILFFIVYNFYFLNFILNPGIIFQHYNNIEYNSQCSVCKVYYRREDRVEHCGFCNVCVKGMDHHCVWIGKCVGKRNIFTFYGMLFSVAIFYIYILGVTFYNLIYQKK